MDTRDPCIVTSMLDKLEALLRCYSRTYSHLLCLAKLRNGRHGSLISVWSVLFSDHICNQLAALFSGSETVLAPPRTVHIQITPWSRPGRSAAAAMEGKHKKMRLKQYVDQAVTSNAACKHAKPASSANLPCAELSRELTRLSAILYRIGNATFTRLGRLTERSPSERDSLQGPVHPCASGKTGGNLSCHSGEISGTKKV